MNKMFKTVLSVFDPRKMRSMSLSTTVIASVFFSIVISGIFAGYHARSIIYRNKIADTWAIMYLEAEVSTNRVKNYLEEEYSTPNRSELASLSWSEASSRMNVSGIAGVESVSLQDLGVDSANQFFRNDQPAFRIISVAGAPYLTARIDGQPRSARLKPVSKRAIAQLFGNKGSVVATTYIATREGKVIYSSSDTITDVNFVARPLVQKFIAAPLTGGLQEFKSTNNVDQYGFFLEVPESNLILFSEAPQSVVLSSLKQIVKQYVIVLLVIVILVLAGISFPLVRLTNPLVELSRVARAVGAGDLTSRVTTNGFGEVAQLGEAFNAMVDGLNQRDEEISRLLVEKTEKIRLAAELKVAQGIQTNLLPKDPLEKSSGLDVTAEYHPATECAGDWYQYHYNEIAQETIVVVVDVSGHGSGSSMFTALIAGVFDQFRRNETGAWNLSDLMTQMGDVVYRFGKGAWHATVLIARYTKATGKMDLLSSGHTPPIVVHSQNDKATSTEKIRLPSQIIGNSKTTQFAQKTLSLSPGDLIFFYTDGFTEAKDPAGFMMSSRALHKVLSNCSKMPSSDALLKVVKEWEHHRKGQPALDDACVVMVRVA